MPDFTDLLEAQIPRLRRYARALVRDTVGADDLVQDTLVRALAKQDRWLPGTNLWAWLFTLMHNQFVNNVRRFNRANLMVDVDEVSSTLVAVADPTASCRLRELEAALARLPVEQREVILLVGLEGRAIRRSGSNSGDTDGNRPLALVPRPRDAAPAFGHGRRRDSAHSARHSHHRTGTCDRLIGLCSPA